MQSVQKLTVWPTPRFLAATLMGISKYGTRDASGMLLSFSTSFGGEEGMREPLLHSPSSSEGLHRRSPGLGLESNPLAFKTCAEKTPVLVPGTPRLHSSADRLLFPRRAAAGIPKLLVKSSFIESGATRAHSENRPCSPKDNGGSLASKAARAARRLASQSSWPPKVWGVGREGMITGLVDWFAGWDVTHGWGLEPPVSSCHCSWCSRVETGDSAGELEMLEVLVDQLEGTEPRESSVGPIVRYG